MAFLDVRRLALGDLHDDALDNYDRTQETTKIRVVVDGVYQEKDLAYDEDWDASERRRIIQSLRACIEQGGVVVGALDGTSIMGFANITSTRFGSRDQYVEMPYLHVSRQLRGKGIGRQLFDLATQEARSLGAPLLYIATNPAVATQAFYDAMGCAPAQEQKPVKQGNDEIHHEFVLNLQQFDTSGVQQQVAIAAILSTTTDKARPVLLLIGGCGGSGKSTLAEHLAAASNAPVIHLDDFAQPGKPGWDEQRFDEQVAIPLSLGKSARYQRYDWDRDQLAEWYEVEPEGLVIVEGVTALTIDAHTLDGVRIWVDAPRFLRLERGIARDGEAMRSTWTDVWMCEEDAYAWRCHPWDDADFVVDGTLPIE